MKSGSPSRTTAKHKLKIQAWSSLVFHCCHSSFNPSEAPPWDSRPVQVSFITNYSTGLAPFPRLSAPPHSPHTRCAKPLIHGIQQHPHRPSTATVTIMAILVPLGLSQSHLLLLLPIYPSYLEDLLLLSGDLYFLLFPHDP